VNSALHRARVTLEKNYHTDKREVARVRRADAETNALLSRYVQAWETDDVSGLVALLKEDAILSMPPVPSWYRGRDAIRSFLLRKFGVQNDCVSIQRMPMHSPHLLSIGLTHQTVPIKLAGFKLSPSIVRTSLSGRRGDELP